ncbi:hypothetical protein EDC01DRAFT_759807 [Geopyxis carbonaria]|nr:hypothetical protein EDC01DRAFT_759807 [Geopyxis carbonaria]
MLLHIALARIRPKPHIHDIHHPGPGRLVQHPPYPPAVADINTRHRHRNLDAPELHRIHLLRPYAQRTRDIPRRRPRHPRADLPHRARKRAGHVLRRGARQVHRAPLRLRHRAQRRELLALRHIGERLHAGHKVHAPRRVVLEPPPRARVRGAQPRQERAGVRQRVGLAQHVAGGGAEGRRGEVRAEVVEARGLGAGVRERAQRREVQVQIGDGGDGGGPGRVRVRRVLDVQQQRAELGGGRREEHGARDPGVARHGWTKLWREVVLRHIHMGGHAAGLLHLYYRERQAGRATLVRFCHRICSVFIIYRSSSSVGQIPVFACSCRYIQPASNKANGT